MCQRKGHFFVNKRHTEWSTKTTSKLQTIILGHFELKTFDKKQIAEGFPLLSPIPPLILIKILSLDPDKTSHAHFGYSSYNRKRGGGEYR